MKPIWLIAILGSVLLVGCGAEPQVTTGYGVVEGKRDDGILEFLGIPYAQPPVDDLRWADPQPPQPWEGVLQAKYKGNACTQWATGLPVVNPSEDCLSLNIWTPDTEGPHPVMFWVHGGAQAAGSSSELQYDGKKLAQSQNVVVVSANYRLLISGFFALPALGAGEAVNGNQAIKDLLAALQWVQDEIHRFGGDPDNVTVFGESAGATNTCAVLASPQAHEPQPLLHKAILQSGACDTLGILTLEQAQQIGIELVAELGCLDTPNPLQCAREVPVETIRDLKKYDLFTSFGWTLDEWTYRPGLVIDGDVFPESPLDLVAQYRGRDIPLLLGTNKDEGSLFAGFLAHPDDAEGYAEFMESRYPGQGEDLAALYPFADYPNAGSAHAQARGDLIMKCPTLNMARTYSEHDSVWMYSLEEDVFSVVMSIVALGFKDNAPELGVFHTADVGYLFEFPLLSAQISRSDRRVRDLMQQAWGNFARTGNPNGEGVPYWAPYEAIRDNYYVIQGQPDNRDDFRGDACDYWFEVGYGF
ncbi:MAG: carboxylesterase family protein [Pseudomonadota bacterium]|nr:carboxylesterase family protein [Pseudomonadota bacterium]